jgi:hypothetical protein
MIISKEDRNESKKVRRIIQKVEKIDANYVSSESEIINQKQPFLISLLLGFRDDLKETELEEIMKIIFIIWEYFKSSDQINKTMISENLYSKILNRNINMLKYLEGEDNSSSISEITEIDLSNLRSKALFSGIIFQFKNKRPLIEMNNKIKGYVLIGMKSLIECFDEIIKKN